MGTQVGVPQQFEYSRLKLVYTRDPKNAPSAIKGYRGRYAFLSNFDLGEFELYGIEFSSSEQAYMWHKSDDELYRRALMAEHRPGKIKRLGYSAVLPADWNEIGRYRAMYTVLSAKFEVDRYKQRLLDTEYAYLEETNWHNDIHWGVNAITGRGADHLGRIQMCVRDEKRSASK